MSIFVAEHNPAWANKFEKEARSIREALSQFEIDLHHIGSTAVPGILAKPIVDIMGVVKQVEAMDTHAPQMQALGYEAMGEFGIVGRRYYRKIDASAERTHHFHVFGTGSPDIERHLAFRDYLINHPDVAATYSALKARLVAGGVSWEAYMDGKDPFIKETEAKALAWYRTPAKSD